MANTDIAPKATSTCSKSVDCYLKVHDWSIEEVMDWVRSIEIVQEDVVKYFGVERIDGEALLILTETDLHDWRYRLRYNLHSGEIKKLWLSIKALQTAYISRYGKYFDAFPHRYYKPTKPMAAQLDEPAGGYHSITHKNTINNNGATTSYNANMQHAMAETSKTRASLNTQAVNIHDILSTNNPHIPTCIGFCSSPCSAETSKHIPPELFKTLISLGYSFLVTWITSFVMVIVHERVPDMKRYPPLPDIFLDNVPHIPWAFHMCEITGTLLFAIWTCVIIFHKHRTVLLRRFFALAGTVFLLRCVTMLITSLSVPGSHLQCDQNDYAIDDTQLSIGEALEIRITRAYIIWSGLGMSIQGVRTCGDYMFSGHTVALTLLNFFITEYTPRNLYFLHTLTWLLNMFGIFFILAAHEHYSIDVFVAFYITSRLFLYYHTLANNQALMSHDSNRTRIWFPMFSYFESSVEGIVPNEYDSIESMAMGILNIIMEIKEACMLTTRRIWLYPQNFQNMQYVAGRFPNMTPVSGFASKPIDPVATSTASSVSNLYDIPTTPSQRSSNSNASLLSSYWLGRLLNGNQECAAAATATAGSANNGSETENAKKQN